MHTWPQGMQNGGVLPADRCGSNGFSSHSAVRLMKVKTQRAKTHDASLPAAGPSVEEDRTSEYLTFLPLYLLQAALS